MRQGSRTPRRSEFRKHMAGELPNIIHRLHRRSRDGTPMKGGGASLMPLSMPKIITAEILNVLEVLGIA